MKYNNGLLVECTEKELYNTYIQNKKLLNCTYDEYRNSAEQAGCKITNQFIVVEEDKEK